jgi:phenylpyruvate tautomerase PptA (4-oxalocrotonate tautomerase family)
MPHAVIHGRKGVIPRNKALLLSTINRAMINALKVPDDNHPVRLSEYEVDEFLIPNGASENFTLIEATLFPGRSLDTKKALYQTIAKGMSDIGVAPDDVRVVVYEVPLDNWGLLGGKPASAIDLGFQIEI